jgi:hypothetical protein
MLTMEAERLKLEPCQICRPVVTDSHHFDEEQHPDPHLSEKSDLDLRLNEKRGPDLDVNP